jgi:hypothetical protein
MKILDIPAMSGAFFDDILVILSLAGCSLMFLAALGGPRLRQLGAIGEWCLAPLVFGVFFQVSQWIVGYDPERIGFLVPMPTALVNVLFAISLLLFAAQWWIKRKMI